MYEENDDREFEVLLEDKRHKEIIDALRSVSIALKNEAKSDVNIEQAISKQTLAISLFVEAVKKISPSVNVEINQDKVVESLKGMCKDILEGLKDLKKSIDEKPKEWEFDIQRNYGIIQKVIAKAK